MEAYKHCFYDRNSGKIYLRTVADTKYQAIPYEKDYWVKDPTGKSNITDLYGVPMIRKTKFDKDAIKSLKSNGIPIAESDLKEEVKFMHSVYDKEKLEADITKWNICFFDIEVASDDTGFPYAEYAAVPINLITCYSTKTKQTYTWGLGQYTGTNPLVINYRGFTTEEALLTDWLKWFDKQCFDLWTGWNSKLFDVPYIVNRIKNVREKAGITKPIENKLSPVGKAPVYNEVTDRVTGTKMGITYDIPGLLHHDYMDLYKSFAKHDPLPSYSLNYVRTQRTWRRKVRIRRNH